MQNIPTELQGQGTYDYRCDKPDCFFCTGIKEDVIKREHQIKIPLFKKTGAGEAWSEYEILYLINNRHLPYKTLASRIPNRTYEAVCLKIRRLIELGVCQKKTA